MIRTFTTSFLLSATLAGYALLTLGATTKTFFQTGYEGTQVFLDWNVPNETGIVSYEVDRKDAAEAAYVRLNRQLPDGQGHYRFVDATSYRDVSSLAKPATYRLTIRSTTGEESFTSVPNLIPNAVERSWGSVKIMFR